MIFHDLRCPTCHDIMPDFPLPYVPDGDIIHWPCGTACQIVSNSRHYHAAVHHKERCVVFRDKNGKIHYPGRNDVAAPAGFERVELNSFREIEKFSRENNTRNEIEGYEVRGTGRGFEYDGNPVAPPNWKEQIRWQE